ncbi:hypothetical protein ACFUOZ_08915 [Paenarthrobacter sp. NPDC057355]|uniref:hypothetical protein n=1 Tax=Paenarthrobacter sp. NPDC057355 TaxID=3346105 RepID=UPI0036333402
MCTHANSQICLQSPQLVRASISWSGPDCLLEFEYDGELPCTGAFIMGIEMSVGSRPDIRHCCIELHKGVPTSALTYDFNGHWQADHGPIGSMHGTNIVRGRFPAWSIGGWTHSRAATAFAIQNGATIYSGVQVTEGTPSRSDQLHLEAL